MCMVCRPKWPFLHMYGSHDVRHVDFRGLTGSQRTPGFWGVTAKLRSYIMHLKETVARTGVYRVNALTKLW